jgi:mono/diheme cytochrome c family protein
LTTRQQQRRTRGRLLAGCLALGFLAAGCQQQMADQGRYEPLEASDFFNDRRSARPQVAGTVARGQLRTDEHFYTGKVNGQLAATFPFAVTAEVLDRGQERFNIYCAPCHDQLGTGLGMVVRRGYRQPPSFHDERLRTVAVGYFYDVMTNGFGAMPDYAAQISPRDRWSIAAYVRALQLSRSATLADVPPGERGPLTETPE